MNLHLVVAVAVAVLLGGVPDKTTPKSPNTPTQKPTRVQLAKDGWKLSVARYQAGSATFEEVGRWGQWLYDAERSVDGEAARAEHLSRLRDVEHLVDGRVQAGSATQLDLLAVRYLLATAEAEAK